MRRRVIGRLRQSITEHACSMFRFLPIQKYRDLARQFFRTPSGKELTVL
jgi:hypothetical protein